MSDKFLAKTYGLSSAEETRDHYDKWAASYESEVAENGYVTPGRIADALWSKLPEPQTPILDFGCGTGLSGLALRGAGFEVIDGMDPSSEMLEGARAKSAYRNLHLLDINDPTPIAKGAYKAITAIGVLGTGAAPPATFDLLMNALDRGDMLAFSYNDHALADRGFTGKLNEWIDCGAARLLFREYGPHLPGQDMGADVYVLEKA
ncbi:class I SAM-dependent methyltransferase [Ruegeria sp. 2205SS24-7]|uniref:class I SAM-dependent DNA methyltransferase n=1 Tax=Ruegeria discodermiae TaxID=3064389 RepID=UPI0027413821|nr:class I SAM-dependent methyltransferase [Ruegeria sp. 2205SS24-7]MDP5216334.1 class I SAM-dependent methyltransferase [Ruegeria sp. 2205SS24-7]